MDDLGVRPILGNLHVSFIPSSEEHTNPAAEISQQLSGISRNSPENANNPPFGSSNKHIGTLGSKGSHVVNLQLQVWLGIYVTVYVCVYIYIYRDIDIDIDIDTDNT